MVRLRRNFGRLVSISFFIFIFTTLSHPNTYKYANEYTSASDKEDVIQDGNDKPLHTNHSRICSQEERFARLYAHCPNIPTNDDIDKMTDAEINKMSHWFLVADRLKTLTCMHYKAGWTSQRLILMNNSADEPTKPVKNTDGKGQFHGIEKLDIEYLSNKKWTVEEKRYRIKNYFKFTFVRHPYDRILSGYKDKLVVEIDPEFEHTGDYYQVMLPRILKKVNHELLSEPLEKLRIPFSYVIRYLQMKGHDWHFHSDYESVCHHCKFKYDYIGKVETWDHDMGDIIDNHFPKKRGKSTKGNVNSEVLEVFHKRLEEYEDLSEEQFDFLNGTFMKDMDLFGYSWMRSGGQVFAGCDGECC